MAFTAENVEKAIQEFYNGTSSSRADAHDWITKAQVSPEAWNFCWLLLRLDKPQEVQFFGASTLQLKITRFWHEIPSDQFESLRQKLLEFLINYANGPRVILNRICIALASYMILTIREQWCEAVPEIISTFQQQNSANLNAHQNVAILLEILTVLPEEFQTMVLPSSYRGVVRQKLAEATSQVLGVLEYVVSHGATSTDLRLSAIRCFTAWIHLGLPLTECGSMLSHALRCTEDDELCDDSLECLSAVVGHPDADKYACSLRVLIGHVVNLDSILARSISEGDTDRAFVIYSLFTMLAETHTKMILDGVMQNDEFGRSCTRLVQIILQCTATSGQYPTDETCSQLTFYFWYLLQEEIVSSEPDRYGECVEKFVPVYSSLVDILLAKCRFPPDAEYQTWSLEYDELFRIYRQDIRDTLVYCYKILDESLLQLLCTRLDAILNQLHANPNEWQVLEACLFAFESVAEGVAVEENSTLPQFFARLSNVPLNNGHVASAVLSAIGAYSEWIQDHPEVLSNVIPLLVLGLTDESMAPAATRALKEISRDCQQHMASFAGQILSHSQRALSSGNLHSSECVRLMCTVGSVLSILRNEEILPYLNELLTPFIRELQSSTRRQSEQQTVVLRTRVIVLLNMLGLLFANLDVNLKGSSREEDAEGDSGDGKENVAMKRNSGAARKDSGDGTALFPDRTQPILLVLQHIMPVIQEVSISWNDDDAVIEAVCDVLKKAVSTLHDACFPLVVQILELMVNLYRRHPRVAILDLAKLLLLLFGKNEQPIGLLRTSFASIVQVTLDVCQTEMVDNTDLVQGFLQVLAQLFKKNAAFLQHSDFDQPTLFRCGIAAISLPETPTVKAASSFLVAYINQSRDNEFMANIVNENGKSLVEQTLRCIGGEAWRDTMAYMADILLSLNKGYFQQLCQWMATCLQREGFPSRRITMQQKEHYMRLILTEKVNKVKLKEVIAEFTLVCLGIMGTEYAAQTTPRM